MKYSIRDLIVRTEYAEVFLAESTETEQNINPLIVKTLIPELNKETQGHLYIAKQLKHKNIQRLIDFGERKSSSAFKCFAVYKYESGVTLTQVIKEFKKVQNDIPAELIFDIGITICNILKYTHSFYDSKTEDFVPHGNISTDSIIISYDGKISIADMGIGNIIKYRYNGEDIVENEFSILTHPDLLAGKKIEKRHEIYSLGMLILLLLSGNSETAQNNLDPKKLLSIVSGKDIAEENTLKNILKRLISNRSIKIAEVEVMLQHFAESQNIHFSQQSTAMIINSLFNNSKKSQSNTLHLVEKESKIDNEWVVNDFVTDILGNQEKRTNIESVNEQQSLIDPETNFAYETKTIPIKRINEFAPSHKPIESKVIKNPNNYLPIKEDNVTVDLQSKTKIDCLEMPKVPFSSILKATYSSQIDSKNPFSKIIKKEDVIL